MNGESIKPENANPEDINSPWQQLEQNPHESKPAEEAEQSDNTTSPDSLDNIGSDRSALLAYLENGTPHNLSEDRLEELMLEIIRDAKVKHSYEEALSPFYASEDGQAMMNDYYLSILHEDLDHISPREDILGYIGRRERCPVDLLKQERPDIYSVSDQEVRDRMRPIAVEFITNHFNDICKFCDENPIDYENYDQEKVMQFLSEVYDRIAEGLKIESKPRLQICFKDGTKRGEAAGCCLDSGDAVQIIASPYKSTGCIVANLCHELWHKRQHELEDYDDTSGIGSKYAINNALYVKNTVDAAAYRGQLVEKEAYYLGNNCHQWFVLEYLERNPDKIDELAAKHSRAVNGELDPDSTADGFDMVYYEEAAKIKAEQ